MIRLYEHNQAAYESVVRLLSETGKAAVIHPTGTGKSFIGFKLCEDNIDKTVCWLSPSEYIFRTQIENLKETGADVPENIRFFTYSKLMMTDESELGEVKPAYIILDEFHRCGADMWGRGVKKLLSMYSEASVVGLSATSIRYLDNRRDMAEELFEGCIASEMTLSEAIVRGILDTPKYVLSVFSYQKDLEKYGLKIKKSRNKAVREVAEKYLEELRRTLEMSEGLDEVFFKHMTDRTGKYIVFCSSKEHMDDMMEKSADWLRKVDAEPHIYSVYSEDPSAGRTFDEFKKDNDKEHLKLLYCIDALNEGIHVEGISGVILLRPTVSPIIFKQQIGRALSASSGSKPVIFDIVNNISGLYSISTLQDEMREIVRYYEYLGEKERIVNDSFDIFDEVREARKLFDELDEVLSTSWEAMYEEARKYYAEFGDLLPQQSYVTESGARLGQWIITQRNNYRKGIGISETRIKRLDEIGMDWRTQSERLWDEGFKLAKDYYEKHGDLNVTKNYSKLSLWLSRQRRKYREGILTSEQVDKLNKLNIAWELEDSWEQKYSEAKAYYEKNGNLDIPARYITKNGTALGVWYRTVKDQYRTGKLSDDRIKKLEEIGMKWDSVKERNWLNYFELAKEYFQKHGDLNVNSGYEKDGAKLGIWISTQRSNYKKGKLTDKQIEMLESIGMSWQRFAGRWEEAYRYAETYFNEFGALTPAADYITPDGFALGAWIATQRRKYSSGKLTEHRKVKLDRLNMIWNPSEASWNEGYEHAARYHNNFGDLNIPLTFVCDDGYSLGAWIGNQRTRHRTGKLTAEREKLLNELGMRWNIQAEKWDSGYTHALEYCADGGNVPIPKSYISGDGYPLGEWIRSQERSYKKGVLDISKIRKLAEIGIEFEI